MVATSFIAAALLGVAAAAPAKSSTTTKASKTTTAASTKTSAAKGGQTPFMFPLPNGFPNPSNASLTAIEQQAQGTLPDVALPSKLAAADVGSFELIAFNEIFEVAFFTSLINNITSNSQGFGAPVSSDATDVTANELVEILKTVQAQEQLHALAANAVLTTSGNKAIKPCEYVFPSSTLTQAVRFASTFTDVVLGALGAVNYGLAENNDAELIPIISGVVAQEGEQDGYYRSLLGLNPSAQPFLTAGAGAFAYNVLLQTVIVPGSCPAVSQLDIPVFEPLTITTPTPIADKDQTLSFSFMTNGTKTDTSNYNLVYVNAQNTPIVEKMMSMKTSGKTTTFSATFPYSANLLEGLTYAVVADGSSFASAADVAAKTVYGPALIEIN